MIRALLHRRRIAQAARLSAAKEAADLLIARCDGNLNRAFWRAHERALDAGLPRKERQAWRDLLDEIDERRPQARSRGDAATRLLFGR